MAVELQPDLGKVKVGIPRPRNARRSASQIIVVVVAVLIGDAGQRLSAQSLAPNSGISTRIQPPITTSAVAHSPNCDRLTYLSGELQRQIEREDLRHTAPLTPRGKFRLAIRNFSDPVNIGATAADSAISNVVNSSDSAFGNGWSGFGKRFGMSMADDGLNEFFSTFLVSSLAHQNPHYQRNPRASTGRRIVYALSRVVIARSDSGTPMFNYAEFVGTTSSALVESTYHFDRDESPGAISSRIFVSIGSDAAWNLMNEFLPDIAKRVNPRSFFLRRLAEKAAKQN